ncbi:hypothetical protein ACRRTK_015203 [Alexandromys fortis]
MFFWTIWFPSSVYSILKCQASYFKLLFLICCVISAASALLKVPQGSRPVAQHSGTRMASLQPYSEFPPSAGCLCSDRQ